MSSSDTDANQAIHSPKYFLQQLITFSYVIHSVNVSQFKHLMFHMLCYQVGNFYSKINIQIV